MTININESFLTEKALDYANLSDLAYATWIKQGNSWVLDSDQKDFSRYNKMWKELADPETGKGYTIVDHTPNDPLTGFSATIFQKGGKNILAIRGTGPDDNLDRHADWALGADKVLPYGQFQSLVEYIHAKGLNGFDVTGHSLGGFLAQVTKATFTAKVADVYTYNAPGPKDLQQFDYRGVDAQGNVTLAYLPKIFAPEDPDPYISFTWPPSTYTAYQTFFANQQSSAMDSHVYNVSGGIWSAPIAGTGTDIGSDVFTATSSHSIQEMIYSLQRGKYYIDPHKPVTFVGSKADEIIDGLSLTGTSITNPIQPLTLMGGYGNDKLYGSDGDDTLYGDMAPEVPTATTGNSGLEAKAGNDHLYGGRGNDTLVGGEGDDVYHIRCGEGNDTIEDTSGENTIIYTDGNGMSRTLKFFYSSSSGSWTTPDGKATISGNKITMEDGQTITLSAGTGPENFGIHKLDKPEDMGNFNPISGDLAPVDFDPEEPGIQTRTDEWGNVITTANPEADRQDTLYDTPASDKIEGKGNDDYILVGRGGNDWITGGDGNDEIRVNNTAPGNLIIEGNAGADHMTSGAGNDRIFCEDKGEMVDLVEAGETADGLDVWGDHANGRGGNDYIYGSAARDLLVGGLGSDLVAGGGGDDALFGDGNVTFLMPPSWSIAVDGDVFAITMEHGSEMNDEVGDGDALYGGAGNDWIAGQGGDDEIYAGEGNDYAFGGSGSDFISGGAGNDAIKGDSFSIAAGFHGDDYIDGGAGDDRIWGDGGSDIIDGGTGNDEIYGDDRIVGLADQGDDYIDGGDGNDRIFGGGGNDVVLGGKGEDLIEGDGLDGPGNDYIDGGDDNDMLIGVGGSDVIFGGAGNDIIAGDSDDTPLDDQGDDYMSGGAGDDQIIGYGGNDVAFGGADNDRIWGGIGDDIIGGDEGADELNGGEGNDVILGGDGNDQIWGGAGDDIIGGDEGDDIVQADDGNDTISGGAGNDILLGAAGNDTIFGDEGDDHLQGDAGNDYLDGGAGDDILVGLDGNDTIYGSAGDDQIWGGVGADTIDGGAGDDILIGEAGNDVYLFGSGSGHDSVGSFEGNDTVLLDSGISPSDVELDREHDDLILSIRETGDTLTAGWWFVDMSKEIFSIDAIQFADGTVWDALSIKRRAGIRGTDGDDVLEGDSGANRMRGLAGNDVLYGFAGDDTLDGGPGNDTMSGGLGDDLYVVDAPGDIVMENADEGTDTVRSFITHSLTANMENLALMGAAAINGQGNELDNVLTGNDGANILEGCAGNDTLAGGGGDDILSGGAGDDRYLFNPGDGVDTLHDSASEAEGNEVVFGEGIASGDLRLDRGSLLIRIGDSGDGLRLDNFNPDDVYGPRAVNRFVFSDGAVLTYEGLIGRGFDMTGTPGDDRIDGTNVADRVMALAGNDVIETGAGDDILSGGEGDDVIRAGSGDDSLRGDAGNDTLNGGEGSDTYHFGLGDGMDTLSDDDPAGTDINRLELGSGIVQENLSFDRSGNDLVMRIQDSTDGVTVKDWFSGSRYTLDAVAFADGRTLSRSDIENIMVNRITGTEGNDFLNGTDASDIMTGKGGCDLLYGGGGDDTLEGGTGRDCLLGGSGNDRLDGGSGMDILFGGSGDDTYVVDNRFDMIFDEYSGGMDTVESSVSYALGGYLENLRLTGNSPIRGTGNSLDNVLTGNGANNVLVGCGGNDTLDGRGGSDILEGGMGSDTYLYRRADGRDTISDYGFRAGDVDILKLTDGIGRGEPVVVKQNDDLYLFLDESNYTRITSQFRSTSCGIERLEVSDGYYITRSDIENIVDAMSAINNDSGMDVIQKYNAMRGDQAYINILAQSWHQP